MFSRHHFAVSEGRLRAILAPLKGIEHSDALDIGCGDGSVIRALKRDNPSSRYVGIDISGASGPGIEIADFRTWSGGSFDLVIAAGVLHLMDMPDDELAGKLAATVNRRGVLLCDLPSATMGNFGRSALRRAIAYLPSKPVDHVALALARMTRPEGKEFLSERLAYLRAYPFRYFEPFAERLHWHGFRSEGRPITLYRSSRFELTILRCLFRRV